MEITLYSLGDYNNGLLIAKTFDLELIDSESEFHEQIAEWLAEVDEERPDEYTNREEWIVADYEGIPSEMVGTYSLNPNFWTYKEALGTWDKDIVEAAMELGIPADKIDAAYVGSYDSDDDFAYELFTATNEIPTHLEAYINWEAVTRSVMFDHDQANGHYFSNYY